MFSETEFRLAAVHTASQIHRPKQKIEEEKKKMQNMNREKQRTVNVLDDGCQIVKCNLKNYNLDKMKTFVASSVRISCERQTEFHMVKKK